jgi:hypothetical protein
LQFYFDLVFFVGDRAVEERKMLLQKEKNRIFVEILTSNYNETHTYFTLCFGSLFGYGSETQAGFTQIIIHR